MNYNLITTGGYDLPNAARYWTYLTSILCDSDKVLDDEIPDNAYFLEYGPGYELSIDQRKAKDLNSDEKLNDMFMAIKRVYFIFWNSARVENKMTN